MNEWKWFAALKNLIANKAIDLNPNLFTVVLNHPRLQSNF